MECEVIRDLLPLYIDGVCSRKSRELVEEHLKACESCREEAAQMRRDIEGLDEEQELEEELVLKEKRLLEEGKRKIENKVENRYVSRLTIMDMIVNGILTVVFLKTNDLHKMAARMVYHKQPFDWERLESLEYYFLDAGTSLFFLVAAFLVCDIIIWIWQKKYSGRGWSMIFVSFGFKIMMFIMSMAFFIYGMTGV